MCAATGILPQKNVGCFLSGGFPISNWRLGRSTKGVPGDIMLPAVFVRSFPCGLRPRRQSIAKSSWSAADTYRPFLLITFTGADGSMGAEAKTTGQQKK